VRVSIVDFGVGNLQSVANACQGLGIDTQIASTGDELRSQSPERIILPGVGAVGVALKNLADRGFAPILSDLVVVREVPLLGICVGMHVLADTCEEFGIHKGFGWIPGRVSRLFPEGSGVRLPHVGWNQIQATNRSDPVFGQLDGTDFYFVHSFALRCPEQYVAATTDYHGEFVSAVRRNHIVAVQFHPEKSASHGRILLNSFLES